MAKIVIEIDDNKAQALVDGLNHDGWIKWDPYDSTAYAYVSLVEDGTEVKPTPTPRRRRHRR